MIIIKKSNSKNIALQVAIVTIIINVLLSALKMVAGIIGKSSAMITDAIHSVSDIFSTVFVIIGIAVASRPLDKNHPYGHQRFECVFSLILAVLLLLTGGFIGYSGILKLLDGSYKTLPQPTLFALISAIVSIVTKEAMYWYTIISAKKINSIALKADAWHHRTDAISSVGSLIAIGLSMAFDMPIFDIIASIIICILIIKVAISIFIESINELIDKSCPDDMVEDMKKLILSCDGVLGVDSIKTRMFGSKIYVDIEISAYKELKLEESHKIAETVHITIEQYNKNILHCMVHVNPANLDGTEDECEHFSQEKINDISEKVEKVISEKKDN